MTPPELDQLEALVKAMTPGPWKQCSASEGRCLCGLVWSIPADLSVASVKDWGGSGTAADSLDDGAGIVALVNAAPALIALAREHFFLLRKHVDLGESFWRSKEEAFRRHAKMHARAQVAEVALAKLGRAYAELQGDAACDVGVPA